jgi:hypothetical protein
VAPVVVEARGPRGGGGGRGEGVLQGEGGGGVAFAFEGEYNRELIITARIKKKLHM